jgi:hypothetical protein
MDGKTLGVMRDIVARHAQQIVFEGLLAGYASGNAEAEEVNGVTRLVHADKEWRITDEYVMTQLDGIGSGGTTLMYYNDQPIWMMQYWGRYKKEALPCLKEALRTAYSAEEWVGGRGPAVHACENGWKYMNYVNQPDSFFSFSGEERVYSPEGEFAGWHKYGGQWLLNHGLNPRRLFDADEL